MEENQIPAVEPVNDSTPKVSIATKISKIFYEPKAVFPALTGKWDWLAPLLIIVVLGFGVNVIMRAHTADEIYAMQVESIDKFKDRMPASSYNEALKGFEEQSTAFKEYKIKWYEPLSTLLFVFVIILIVGLIAWVSGNFIFGGKAGFWKVVNVVSYASLITFAGTLIKSVMAIGKGSLYVYTGLGVLGPVFDHTGFLFYFLRLVDLFVIWKILVLCIGLGVLYKTKTKKFGYLMFSVWFFWIMLLGFVETLFPIGSYLMFGF